MFSTPPAAARTALPLPGRARHSRPACCPRWSGALDWPAAMQLARPWVQAVRDKPAPFWAMESLLREYPISSAEGLALMRLAEALLRVPDAETAIALTADQLGKAEFDASAGRPAQDARQPCRRARSALSKKFLPEADADQRFVQAPGRADRGRGHGACDPAARPPVRARPLDPGGDGRGRGCAQGPAEHRASATTCSAKAHAPKPMRGATWPRTRTPSSTLRRAAAMNPHSGARVGRRHLDQAQRAVLALRRRAARAGVRRTAAARLAAHRSRRRAPTST